MMSNFAVVADNANLDSIEIYLFNPDSHHDSSILSKDDLNWLEQVHFSKKSGEFYLKRNDQGQLINVYFALNDLSDGRSIAALADKLPGGHYRISTDIELTPDQWLYFCLAWSRAGYHFNKYKSTAGTVTLDNLSVLCVAETLNLDFIQQWQQVSAQAKDLINTPAEDLTPQAFVKVCQRWAEDNAVNICVLEGDDLLSNNFPTVHRVGRSSHNPPALIDMRWGKAEHMKVTLVGKGVCFDTGGLNIKPTSGMRHMKKDMGGAAMAFALAQMIVSQQLPICLRVLIPTVDNIIAANSMLPGDVVTTRSGKTVEITNTDAEGRLILCDALSAAAEDNPDYLFDFATLTGAARVALGPSIAALFSNNDGIANQLQKISWQVNDRMWTLPLHRDYFDFMKSDVADFTNSSSTYFAGTITAALYLQQFVPCETQWVHIDAFCWNHKASPGFAPGAEVQTVRAVFEFITQRIGG